MRTASFGFLVLSAASLLACGGSTADDATAQNDAGGAGAAGAHQGGGGGGSSGQGGSAGTGAGGALDAGSAGGDADGGAAGGDIDGGGAAGGDVDGGEAPVACGARAGNTCKDDEYCDFPDGLCGAADGEGTCKKRPDGCSLDYSPVCGCDGKVHSNACGANVAGTDVSALGACEAPAGFIPCGATFCDARVTYCVRSVSDVGGEPDSYWCAALPASCNGAGTCECLASEGCGQWCEEVEGGDGASGAKLTCPGG